MIEFFLANIDNLLINLNVIFCCDPLYLAGALRNIDNNRIFARQIVTHKLFAMQLDPNKFVAEGLTYDDVLLVPAYSEVLPRDVDTGSYLTKNIRINVPIVSAAMDTVTEAGLAIAIAQAGGIGMLHKNMTIERQADEVRKVKRSESGMIQDR
jgi:IMP dehydrogenase